MKSKKMPSKKNMPRQKQNKINLDNEIIIGLNTKKSEPKKVTKTTSKEKTKKKAKKKNAKHVKILKWTSLVVLIMAAIVIFLFSDLFNIKQITVINNNKISSQEIINLSTLKTEENMFKTTNKKIIDNIKTNSYIETVKVSRKLDGTVVLDVTERVATYIIELDNGYAYINNQGYVLEISAIKLEVPNIKGISTEMQNMIPGNRISVEDLKKLDTVIQIMQTAENKQLSQAITEFDITNASNYILNLESEKKTIHFGDNSKINDKMLWIEYAVQENKDVEGTLFVKNIEKPYFRNKV